MSLFETWGAVVRLAVQLEHKVMVLEISRIFDVMRIEFNEFECVE